MEPTFTALLLGVFLSETVKNVAKGSANWIGSNGESLFYSEITSLGLSESATPEEITKQLQAKPEIVRVIEQKVEASPDYVRELLEIVKEQINNDSGVIMNTFAKNIGTVINDSQAPISIKNTFS